MKFCCGVTLYYPSQDELEIISKYKDIFDKVYVFDNTDSNLRILNQNFFRNIESIDYMSNNSNEGLSISFNNLSNKSMEEGYDYICLLDQDSLFPKEEIEKAIKFIRKEYSYDTGIYVPEIIYVHNDNNIYNSSSIKKIEVDWAITSGSFINLKIYRKTKGFDENYFIDRLDQDYCIEVKKKGCKIERIQGVYLYQKLGSKKRTIFGNISQHSPLRHYYIFRNRIYFYKKHEKNKIKRNLIVISLSIRQLFRVVLLEDEKIKKIKMMFTGYDDFFKKNMGKLVSY